MPDIRLISQFDPFAPATQRFVVCEVYAERHDHVVLSNHATLEAATQQIQEHHRARTERRAGPTVPSPHGRGERTRSERPPVAGIEADLGAPCPPASLAT
jgi:hypothetical protein